MQGLAPHRRETLGQIALGVVVGIGGGVAVAALTGGPDLPDAGASAAPRTPVDQTAPARPATGPPSTARTPPPAPPQPLATGTLRSGPLVASLRGAALIPATSASGRARDRLRVVVRVRLRNAGTAPVEVADTFRLAFSGRQLRPDPGAQGQAGVVSLRSPLSPAGMREGELRFELSGATSRALTDGGRARVELTAPGEPPGTRRITRLRLR
ncbi:hypothetical protein [Conexibacter sp. SYSU D00693]|uniref:hypothetical protein n=1 Tax=Conexibacter sp. SYSU D00693 TaxID=2812560 RepID=UPI00196B4987|nr:hypothetical protein [Conexibacter sp. SYSU D00693]